MKRVYFVAVTSDVNQFEEIVSYETKENAKEGLSIMAKSIKDYIKDMGVNEEDIVETFKDDWFEIRYDEAYYFGEIKYGVAFEQGEKPAVAKSYRVTTTKLVLAYSEEDAIEVANSGEAFDYDDEMKSSAEEVK